MKRLKLTAAARRVLDEAVISAGKSGHAEVTRAHLLMQLLAVDWLWPTFLPVRFHRREIATFVAARLEELPSTRVYRDARGRPTLSQELTAILERAGRGLFFFARTVDEAGLLDALLDDPTLHAIGAAARVDHEDLEDCLDRAAKLALARGHSATHVDHVLRLVLDQRWFLRALHAVGAAPSPLRVRVDATLDVLPSVGAKQTFLTEELQQLAGRATHQAMRLGRTATTDLLLAFVLQQAAVRSTLEASRIPPAALLRTLVHGVGPRTEEADDDVETDVIFHNDDFTPQHLVTAILHETFGLDRARALATMLEVHNGGMACAGTYPRAEARERVSTALAVVRNAGFPLRITLLPKGERPDGDR